MDHDMRAPRIHKINFTDLFHLEPHGPDTYVGIVARYPWGGRLFGGQVVAQALRAAIHTVDPSRAAHSFHSYFIRPGSPDEPIRFEVERLRDGRSFTTRQVVARQSGGAILNASVSFQVAEDEADAQIAELDPALPSPEDPALRNDSWGELLDRRAVNLPDGRVGYWIRLTADLGDDPDQSHLRVDVHVRRGAVPGRAVGTSRLRERRIRPHPFRRRQPRPLGLVPPSLTCRRMALVRHPLPRAGRRPWPGNR